MRRRPVLFLCLVAVGLLAACSGGAPRITTAPSSTTTTTSSTTTTSTTSTTVPTTTTTEPATVPTTLAQVATAPLDTTPATDPAPAPTVPTPLPGDGTSVLMVGDSVMLGAQPDLEGLPGWYVRVDARVGRQVGAPYANNGIDAIAADHQAGVDTRVVIHLGTNGLFTDGQLDEIMSLLADVPRVVLLTVRIPNYPDIEAANNEMIRNAPSRYPQIVVVDWKAQSDANPQWLGRDYTHLTTEGRQAYASLVGAAL